MLELTSSIIKIYSTTSTTSTSSTTSTTSTTSKSNNKNKIPILYEKTKDIPVHEWWCLKENNELWFSHKELDTDTFYVKWVFPTECITNIKLNWIIWGDQILRHPLKNMSNDVVRNHRYTLYDELYALSKDLLQHTFHRGIAHIPPQGCSRSSYDLGVCGGVNTKEKCLTDVELVFTLLVIRHDRKVKSKKFAIDYIKNQIICLLDTQQSVPSIYYRFLNTSLKDYMSCLTLNDLKYNRIHLHSTYDDILEFNPEKWIDLSIETINKIKETHLYKTFCLVLDKSQDIIKRQDKLTVSISGGVDSMVLSLCAYVYGNEHKLQVDLIHIQYNNRECCDKEVKFLYDWVNVFTTMELYVRNINELKRRRETEWRELYENITKEFRFHAYSLVGGVILLGHNYEDTLENIITNIATQTHTDNLKGMKYIIQDNSVDLCRPLLDVSKKEIVEFAHKFNIPYLEDSTPTWSKRGQLRDTIIPLLNKFDKNLMKGLYELSNTLTFYKKEWMENAEQWTLTNIEYQEKPLEIKFTSKKYKLCVQAERILKININEYLIRNKQEIWSYIWNKYLNKTIELCKVPTKKGTNRIIDLLENNWDTALVKPQTDRCPVKSKTEIISFPLNKDIYVVINFKIKKIYICIKFVKEHMKKNSI